MSEQNKDVCIVTQPQRTSGKDHAHDLADIIAQITSVVVLTANLPIDSSLRADHEVVEFSTRGTGTHIIVEAIRFVLNQIRLCLAIHHRDEGVVLFFGTTSYLLPVLFSRVVGKTVVLLPRGDVPLSLRLRWEESLPASIARLFSGLVSILEHVNYRLSHAIITYSPRMADQLCLRQYNEKLYTTGARFVDTEQFNIQVPYKKREQAIGFVGRLDIGKGISELVEASRHFSKNIRLILVGDGECRETIENEFKTEIENGQIEIVGWVDRTDVPVQLNRLQLLVLPSQMEGLPTVILESMACGTPAYATPVSGVPDVVQENQTGFLMNNIESKTIAGEVEAILEQENLELISRNARELIEDEYSFDAAVERYRSIFKNIL